MRRSDPAHRGERGQILIMFVLAITVIVGVVGIVLDGGAAYAQRRAEQGVSDLAAMSGATAFLNAVGDYTVKNAAAEAAALDRRPERLHRWPERRRRRRVDRSTRRPRPTSGSTSPASTTTTSRRSSACRRGTSR